MFVRMCHQRNPFPILLKNHPDLEASFSTHSSHAVKRSWWTIWCKGEGESISRGIGRRRLLKISGGTADLTFLGRQRKIMAVPLGRPSRVAHPSMSPTNSGNL